MTLSLRLQSTDRSFERLYRAHVGDVYRYALAVTGNVADAEDVAQTTFMNAYRALERGERPVKPRHWLIAIAHNVCRQRFRQSARRPTEVVYEEDIAEALVPNEETPSAADIQRALGQLALNQREALVMRELEGRSYADIAELLGLSVAAVETLLFRARRALREQLEGSLNCCEAEAALSLQIDGYLKRSDAPLLRSHLRACESCRLLARRQRAQRKSLKALALVPLPSGLTSSFGAAGAAGAAGTAVTGAGLAGIGTALTAKVAAVGVAAALVAGGGSYAVIRHEMATHPRPSTRAAVIQAVSTGTRSVPTSHPPRAHAANPRVASKEHGSLVSKTGAASAVKSTISHSVVHRAHASSPASKPGHATTIHTKATKSHKANSSAPTTKKTGTRTPVQPIHRTSLPTASRPCKSRRARSVGEPSVTTTANTTTTPTAATETTTSASSCPTPQAHGQERSKRP